MKKSKRDLLFCRCTGKKPMGFTLIELLVVIAIIAILAAMLMPALSQARESGRKSVCTSNQAQLIKAIHNYASDNGDYLPAYSHAKKNASEENAKRRWTYSVVPYLGYTLSDELPLPKVFLCPSMTAIASIGSGTVTNPYVMSSYIWNNFAGYIIITNYISIKTNLRLLITPFI